MKRKEFVNKVFEILEEEHINLYHDISKEDFDKQKEKFLKSVDNLNELDFEAGMLRLFALFKDAHTNYYYSFPTVDANLINIGNDFYFKCNDNYQKLEYVNGYPIDKVVDKLKQLVAYEVDTWMIARLRDVYLKSPEALKMVGLGASDDTIEYSLKNKKPVTFTFSQKDNQKSNFTPQKNYSFELKGDILFVKYLRCREMDDYSFAQLMDDIKKSCKKLPKACLVDVRNNTGGNSEIINPLKDWLKERKIKTYVLMNEKTFSSGTFAVGFLKKDLNATILGTDAGQPTICYGQLANFKLDGKLFSACKRYFDFTGGKFTKLPTKYTWDIFDYDGVIKPDVYINKTIEEFNANNNIQLEKALKFIEKDLIKEEKEKSV